MLTLAQVEPNHITFYGFQEHELNWFGFFGCDPQYELHPTLKTVNLPGYAR